MNTAQTESVPKPVVLCLQSSPLHNRTMSPIIQQNHKGRDAIPILRNSNAALTTRPAGLPPTPTSPSTSLLQLPFLYTSPLNSLQQLLSIPSMLPPSVSQPPPPPQLRNNDRDYESPTELYQMIEQKQWKRIIQKFDEEDSDDMDEADETDDGRHFVDPNAKHTNNYSIRRQAAMWTVRKESNGRLKWRILPLHAAIIFRAPHSVIEVILQSHPSAAREKDDQGMIPLHLTMKNFNLQYNHHHSNHLFNETLESIPQWPNSNVSSPHHHPHQLPQHHQFVETITTLWRTVEELLTAYPSGIFSRDRKGRTPLQLGFQTVQTNLDIKSSNHGNSRPNIAIRQQQQEMMLAALSVLQRYEIIYSATLGDRNNTTATVTAEALAIPLPSPQHASGIPWQPPPSIDEDLEHEIENRRKSISPNTAILSIQQQHLETLQTLRTMFQKQRHQELTRHQQQQATLQQQLNDSVNRERQLQIELDSMRHQLQEQQRQNSVNHSNDQEASRDCSNETS